MPAAVINPRLVLAKKIEDVKRSVRKIKGKNTRVAPGELGSTKYISKARVPHKRTVTASVGKKFFRRLILRFLFSFLNRATLVSFYPKAMVE